MFDAVSVIQKKYGVQIQESIVPDYYDNAVLIAYVIDFEHGIKVIVFGDYYMETVDVKFKFTDGAECSIEQLVELSTDLEKLSNEIKNYFRNLRKKH